MKYNAILVSLMLLLLIIPAASAYESDNSTQSIQISAENALELENLQVLTADGSGDTFSDLKILIDEHIASNRPLYLDKNYTYSTDDDVSYEENGIAIDGDLTIYGNGFTLNAHNHSRIFDIKSSSVTLSGIRFINGKSDFGGAVLVENDGDLTVGDCIFENNTASQNGGAICSYNNIDITDSSFIGNYAQNGAAVYAKYSTIENSKFLNNTAINRGAGLYSWGNSLVNNSLFDNNTLKNRSNSDGGSAIYSTGTLNINHTTITNNLKNYVVRGFPDEHLVLGAVTFTNTTKISNSIFENNSGCYGGAISASVNLNNPCDYTFDISNITFNNNVAYNGGAIYVGTSSGKNKFINDIIFTVSDSRFNNNSAAGLGTKGYKAAGGAICIVDNYGHGNISSVNFTGNYVHNHESASGGAISAQNTNLNIDLCNFTDNYANQGGAIEFSGSQVVVNNSNIKNNVAKLSGGGGFYFNSGNLYLYNSNVSDNQAIDKYGGGIFHVKGDLYVYDSDFKNNTADYGGAIASDHVKELEILNSNFTENHALKTYGGALYTVTITKATIKDSTFDNNDAADIAGAIFAYIGTQFDIYDSRFNNNSANTGGAVYLYSLSSNINNTNLTNNNAKTASGGALYIWKVPSVNINSTLMANNTAATNGGAVYSNTVTQMNIADDSIFKNNTATNGGAIYGSKVTLKINDTNFTDNIAKSYGGALYVLSATSNLNITDAYFNKNIASYGSAMFLNGFASYISDTVFGRNRANAADITLDVTTPNYYSSNVTAKVVFKGCDNIANAIWSNGAATEVYVSNITYEVNIKGNHYNKTTPKQFIKSNDGAVGEDIWMSTLEDTQVINFIITPYTNPAKIVYNKTGVLTDVYGNITHTIQNLASGVYNIIAEHPLDDYYTQIQTSTVFVVYDYFKIKKTTEDTEVFVGENVTYTITLNNTGNKDLSDVTLVEQVPDGFILLEKSPQWNVEKTEGDNITLKYNGVIKAGECIALVLTFNATKDGKYNNTIYVSSNETNPRQVNSSNETTVKPYVVLETVKYSNATDATLVGDLIRFTIEVTNKGLSDATDVNITDAVPDAFEIQSIGNQTLAKSDSRNITWIIPKLSRGNTTSVYVIVKAMVNGTFNNTAVAKSIESNKTNSTCNVAVNPKVILKISKTANVTVTYNDSLVKFTVRVENLGPSNATDVTVTDALPRELKLEDIGSDVDAYVTSLLTNDGQIITWTLPKLVKSAEFYITARTTSLGNYTNIADVYCRENRTVIKSDVTVHVESVKLTVSKTVNDAVVANNTLVNFTITVKNNGPVNVTDVIIKDILPAELTFADASGGYDKNLQLWIISKLNSGNNVTFWIAAKSNTVGNWTNHVSAYCSENKTSVSAHADVEVVPVILNITKTSDKSVAENGTLVNFTVTVKNLSKINATDVSVEDALPQGLEYESVGYIGSEGICTVENNKNTVKWNIKELEKSITLWVTAKTSKLGLINNTVSVSCRENVTEVEDSETVNVVIANMTIEKSVNVSDVSVGDIVKFTITVENVGTMNLTDVTVTDILNENFKISEIGNKTYLTDYSSQKIIWTVPLLNAGENAILYVDVKVISDGTFENVATAVSSNTPEIKSSAEVSAKYNPNMTVTKHVNESRIIINEKVEYVIFIQNTGDCNLTDITVSDSLNKNFEMIEFSQGWTYNDGVFTYGGNIPVSGNATLKFTVKITDGGLYNNTAVVSNSQTENKTATSENTEVYIPTHIEIGNVTTYPDLDISVPLNVTADDGRLFTGNVTVYLPDGTNQTAEIINGLGNIVWHVPAGWIPGRYDDTVRLDAVGYYLPSDADGTVTVLPIPTVTTIGNVSGNAGENVTIPVTVTSEDKKPFNGNVTVSLPDGSNKTVEIIGGKGNLIWAIPGDYDGNYTDDASYSGNATYLPSQATGTITVIHIPTHIDVGNITSYPDTNVDIPINVTTDDGEPFSGNITVTFPDGTVTLVEIVDGAGTVTWHVPEDYTPDKYPNSIRFSGNEKYSASNGTGTITVVKIPTHISVENVTAFAGEKVTIAINVTADDGEAFSGNVTVSLRDGSNKTVEITDGKGSVEWTVPSDYVPDSYPDTITFAGNSKYLSSEGTGTVTVVKIPVSITVGNVTAKPGQKVTIPISVIPDDDSVFNGNVTVILPDGTQRTVEIINGEGSVEWTVPEDYGGTYDVGVIFDGNTHYWAGEGSGFINVIPDTSEEDGNSTKDEQQNTDEKSDLADETHEIHHKVEISSNATGNPIFALIMVLIMFVGNIRRFR